jgi:chromosome segregation ATPase
LRSGALTSADATLAQAENLRIAQSRILELETEIERLRSNNEQLAAAGETLRVRADENLALVESITARYQNLESVAEDERVMAQKNIQSKDKELTILRGKIDEMEMRLSTNIQKIRVRERELENRLELVKMESQALLRTKDEMILDLKRQIDQLNLELDNYRNKGQELNKKIHDKQELLRRTVKALRLALSMLEGDDK